MNVWHLLLIPLVFAWFYPFLWISISAFKPESEMFLNGSKLLPDNPTFDNILRAWDVANFADYTVNTIVFTIGKVFLVLIISATAGYALGRGRIFGKKTIIAVLVITMFIPIGYTILPVFKLVSALGLADSLAGAILAASAPVQVVQILLFMGYFASLPRELEEAAILDGAGYVRTFWSVMLPLARPVTGTVALFTFISGWNAFFIPLIFTLGQPQLRTLGVGMYNFYGEYATDWSGLAAAALIALLPVIVVFLILQKSFIEGLAGAVKS